MAEADAKPIAWARRWHADGIKPHKERGANGRLQWPARFKWLPITETKLFDDDEPLFAASQQKPVAEGLVDDLREVRELVALWAEYEPTIGRTGRALGKLDAILATLTKGAEHG